MLGLTRIAESIASKCLPHRKGDPKTGSGFEGFDRKPDRKAPPGKYRVLRTNYVLSMSGGYGLIKTDFDTLEQTEEEVFRRYGYGLGLNVYDDQGNDLTDLFIQKWQSCAQT